MSFRQHMYRWHDREPDKPEPVKVKNQTTLDKIVNKLKSKFEPETAISPLFNDACNDATKGIVLGGGWPYMIPTVLRSIFDDSKIKDTRAFKEGYALGTLGLVSQIVIYGYNINDHPEVLLIPVAANIISALYEGARAAVHYYNTPKK